MRKAIVFFGVFIAVALVYGASDGWKTKPYQQWDQNDVKEVLMSSPWVKRTSVAVNWKSGAITAPENGDQYPPQGQGNTQAAGGSMGQPRMGGSMGGGANGGYGKPQSNPGQESAEAPQGQEASFFVRWNSAQTIREGIARNALLNSQFTQAQAEQFVNETPKEYQLLVFGTDMTPFTLETNDKLKSKTYIEVKPSKEKVSPSAVQIVRDKNEKIQSVVFSFPKQDANGQPLIAANTKDAQFDCKLKNIHLNFGFDLHKMTGKNGLDL